MRRRLRKIGFGLSTVLGLKPRGFFIPYRYADTVTPSGYPALRPIFQGAEARFADVIGAIEACRDDLARIAAGQGPARFTQDWFPRLDAASAYALVRTTRPRRIVEIGSGHSTRFMAQAVLDGALPTEVICIDPQPRASLAGLNVRHVAAVVQQADPAIFTDLAAGDVLFIDSSHIAMPGTDVDRLVLDVLPRLAAGVLIHIHDVFLPDGYPDEWSWRGYNEQLLAGALLLGRGYELVFASHYVARHRPDLIGQGIIARLPLAAGAHETSLWLRKLVA